MKENLMISAEISMDLSLFGSAEGSAKYTDNLRQESSEKTFTAIYDQNEF